MEERSKDAFEQVNANNVFHKHSTVLGIVVFATLILLSCSCFFFRQGRTYQDEQSTGEVYILKDEVVETGYIHSAEGDNKN